MTRGNKLMLRADNYKPLKENINSVYYEIEKKNLKAIFASYSSSNSDSKWRSIHNN
jgi:hypothetical protein